MHRWLLWIHLASVGIFGGALVMLLVLAGAADPMSPLSFGAVRQAMSIASAAVLVPALLVLLVTGFLLLVTRPMLIDARWVWAKAAIGVAIAGISFLAVYPATNRATGYAVQSAAGSVIQSVAGAAADVRAPLDRALAEERTGRWFNLALAMLAAGLAVWRPRLGGRVHGLPRTPAPTVTPSPTSPGAAPSTTATGGGEPWPARAATRPPVATGPAAPSASQAWEASGAGEPAASCASSAVVIALLPRARTARAASRPRDGIAPSATVTVLPAARRARVTRLRRVQ